MANNPINSNEGGVASVKPEEIAAAQEKVQKIIEMIRPKLYVDSRFPGPHKLNEGAMRKALWEGRDNANDYTQIIDILGENFIKDSESGFDQWSHSLCHLFEQYGMDGIKGGNKHEISYEGKVSFLNSKANGETAKKLMTESIRRAIDNKKLECVGRILGPVLEYNLDNIDLKHLDGPFPLKSDLSESDCSALVSLLDDLDKKSHYKGNFYKNIGLFLTAKTPRSLILDFVRKKMPFPTDPKKTVELLMIVKDEISPSEMKAYLNEGLTLKDQEITLDSLDENINVSNEAKEVSKGLYVDVEGTLIVDGKLNEGVMETIKLYEGFGKEIIIFSGGSPDELTSRLRTLGLPEKYLPVKSKKDFQGKILERLVDDTKPEYQGFMAQGYELPRKD